MILLYACCFGVHSLLVRLESSQLVEPNANLDNKVARLRDVLRIINPNSLCQSQAADVCCLVGAVHRKCLEGGLCGQGRCASLCSAGTSDTVTVTYLSIALLSSLYSPQHCTPLTTVLRSPLYSAHRCTALTTVLRSSRYLPLCSAHHCTSLTTALRSPLYSTRHCTLLSTARRSALYSGHHCTPLTTVLRSPLYSAHRRTPLTTARRSPLHATHHCTPLTTVLR